MRKRPKESESCKSSGLQSANGTACPALAVVLVVYSAFAAASSSVVSCRVGGWAVAGHAVPHQHAGSSSRLEHIINTFDFEG